MDSLADPGMLLVARRTAPPQFAGMWEFPGGKVEPGEAAEDALHRELREELGVLVRLGSELPAETATGWPLNEKAAMRVWFAELAEGEPRPLEDHDELRWLDLRNPAEVLGLPWIPADFPIVEALLAAVRATGPRGVGAGPEPLTRTRRRASDAHLSPNRQACAYSERNREEWPCRSVSDESSEPENAAWRPHRRRSSN